MHKHSGLVSSINSLRSRLNNKKGYDEAEFIILKANDDGHSKNINEELLKISSESKWDAEHQKRCR